MKDYTCYDFAKAGIFDASYLTGKVTEDHLHCQEAVERKSWVPSSNGDRVFWCSPASDWFGGSADRAIQALKRSDCEEK